MKTSTFPDDSEGYVLSRGQMTLYDSVEIPHDGIYRFTVRARSTTNGPTGGKLRINDVESGEFDVPDGDFGEFVIETFLPEGSHQMAWNVKGSNRPSNQPKLKKPEEYPPLPENADEIIDAESPRNAPDTPRTGDDKPPLLGYLNNYDSAQSGVQRPY